MLCKLPGERAIERKISTKEILKAIDKEIYKIYNLTNEEINLKKNRTYYLKKAG